MSETWSRRRWMQRSTGLLGLTGLAALPTLSLLSACGGGDSEEGAAPQLRLLNLCAEVPAMELWMEDERRLSVAAVGEPTEFQEQATETLTVKLRRAGNSTDLYSGDRTFGKDEHYTAVAWGRENQLNLATLREDEPDLDKLDSGKALLRIFNASTDLGVVDIYLTGSSTELDGSVPTQGSVGGGQLSGYVQVNSGSQRLRITGQGDTQDLRLDLPSLSLNEKQAWTLVLTAGVGGVLADAVLIEQRARVSRHGGQHARLRVVASVPGQGTVSVNWGGQSLVASVGSPTLTPYTAVAAGSQALSVRLGATLINEQLRNLQPGADYTLLVHGQGQVALIQDDNRLPSSSTRAKLRLVHAQATPHALTLTQDYAVLAQGVASGTASSFASVAATQLTRLDVSSAATGLASYTLEDARLLALGVYTLFALEGADGPTGLLRKDR
ncbi:hypothetical protein HNQ51_001090 [Inhella inkyongensis]|uniref:DUF4397 domain-containing protein n=1 Tax=Inhella inkyongensis TaxID=392593 RepID=A0A840RYI5_9BURK|nr:DUF4397 domain-containing protein [Inhella inkyongensis]MBB5203797.1 hypothetical protein [Inhella inkyongensis]